jgi:hypothetical protein
LVWVWQTSQTRLEVVRPLGGTSSPNAFTPVTLKKTTAARRAVLICWLTRLMLVVELLWQVAQVNSPYLPPPTPQPPAVDQYLVPRVWLVCISGLFSAKLKPAPTRMKQVTSKLTRVNCPFFPTFLHAAWFMLLSPFEGF